MLDPEIRMTLLDALRPPPDHHLDLAVGTSFSLDLEAMLTAPAAFAFYDVQERDTKATPLGLLDSVRRHGSRITIFSQAGQIKVPRRTQLLAFFEKSVVPVAPDVGVFHPKVWLLRFRATSTNQARHRVLCASRNLTYDRSWDTLLRLDSDEDGIPIHGTLPGFVRALVGLAQVPVERTRREAIEALADELTEVRFAPPDHVDELRWHSFGLEGEPPWPFPSECDRLLVISPFLRPTLLDRLPSADRRVVISRPEAIETALPATRAFNECYILRDSADPPDIDADGDAGVASSEDARTAGDPAHSLHGLHAKCYVLDIGNRAKVFTGSANATNAGFEHNVEVLVELTGTRKHLGVERVLDASDDSITSLMGLLMSYEPGDRPSVDGAEEDDPLDDLRREIAAMPFRAKVSDTGKGTYRIRYESDRPPDAFKDVEAAAWPVTLEPNKAPLVLGSDGHLTVEFTVSLEGITAFLAIELTAGEQSTRFVVAVALDGVPEHREQRILRSLLGDTRRLLRYLLLLLADESIAGSDLVDALEVAQSSDGSRRTLIGSEVPLLEVMLRALEQEPGRLGEIERLVSDLRSDGADSRLLPEGFEEIWQPIWAVAREAVEEGSR